VAESQDFFNNLLCVCTCTYARGSKDFLFPAHVGRYSRDRRRMWWWWWAARDKHGGWQRQAQQWGGTRVDVDEAHRSPTGCKASSSSPSYPPRQVSSERQGRSPRAAPCAMLERVADNWWLAREAVSAVMGLWGWPWGRRGPSGFGSASTAEEVTAGVDATNLTAIVTGLRLFPSSFSFFQ
jgi:hypothetical protein